MRRWPEKNVRTPVPSRPMRARAASVGDGVGPAAAVLGGDGHAEEVVLLRQRDDLVVEPVLGVAEFLVRADLLAERLDVGEQLVRGRRRSSVDPRTAVRAMNHLYRAGLA